MDTRSFRQTVGTVHVSYPVPFIFAVSLSFTLACLAAAIIAAVWLSGLPAIFLVGLLAALAVAAFVNGLVLWWHAYLKKSDFVRSERYTLALKLLDSLSDNDFAPSSRSDITQMISTLMNDNLKDRKHLRSDTDREDQDVD